MAEDDVDQGQRKELLSEHRLKQPDDLKQPAPAEHGLKQPAADVYDLKPIPPQDVTPPKHGPPPIPRNEVPSAASKGDGESVKAKIMGIAASLAHQCEVAFHLFRKRLERDKLKWRVLPHAYRALGKHVHGEGAYRGDFPNAYVRLDGLRAEIALLENKPPVEQQATTFMMKAQAVARAARHPLALLVLNGRTNNAFGSLGRRLSERWRSE